MSQISQIDCGELAVIQGIASQKWTDAKINDNYIADVQSALAVLENQQVAMTEITGSKDRKISLEWQSKCDITTSDCSDDCSPGGDDIEPNCKEYAITCLQETGFTVKERLYRSKTIEFQAAVAENMLLHKRAMDEWIANYILAGLDANAGVNTFTGGPGVVNGVVTEIAPAMWDADLFGYFARVIRSNKFRNAYGLTGDNLMQLVWKIQAEAANANGAGNANKLGAISKWYFDPENIEANVDTAKKTYLLHKTAAAFVSKYYNPLGAASALSRAGSYFMWAEPSMNLPGVTYDIVLNEVCSANEFEHRYKIQVHGLFAVNPTPCDPNNTGILAFECK